MESPAVKRLQKILHIFCNLIFGFHSNPRNKMDKKHFVINDSFTDEEIISRITSGEKELYATLIKKYNARLYRIAMAIVNDDTEAEDVMQAAYIKAYENLPRFAFRSAFSTWLTRIMVNECLLKKK